MILALACSTGGIYPSVEGVKTERSTVVFKLAGDRNVEGSGDSSLHWSGYNDKSVNILKIMTNVP